MESIIKIAITGPESTGKSTLARKLAEHYNTIWVPEYARIYLDKLNRPYTQNDLVEITKGQIRDEKEMISKANKYLFCDTEMTVLKIWSEYKYGNLDPSIRSEYDKSSYDLYLLLNVDVPWKYDPQRENPERGKFFFDWFKTELDSKKAIYRIISGNTEERLLNACKAVDGFFAQK